MGVTMNMGYLKSIPGILKIVEFILLLLAFACASDSRYGYSYYYYDSGRVSFFLAVTVIGWLIVIGLFVAFFFDLKEKIKQVNFNLVVFITSVVFAVLLLISSSLMAEIADWQNRHVNYWYGWYKNRWNTLVAATVFGFFSMVAFIVDAVMHFSAVKGGGGGGAGSSGPTNA